MITKETKRLVETQCAKLCDVLGLTQLYLTEIVGIRRHYLAGYGRPALGRPQQIQLTYTIAVFWHGELPLEKEDFFIRSLCPLADRIEKELAVDEQQQCSNHATRSHKGN